jgi:transposase
MFPLRIVKCPNCGTRFNADSDVLICLRLREGHVHDGVNVSEG